MKNLSMIGYDVTVAGKYAGAGVNREGVTP